jgi:hypothetical protein
LISATYTETLTLPSGYLSTTTNPVTTSVTSNTTVNFGIQSASTTTIATDTYTRSVTSDWGTADTGGSYSHIGTATAFNVNGTVGTIDMTATGSANQRTMRLDSAKAQNLDYTVKIRLDKLSNTTDSNYVYLISRHVSSGNEYRGAVRFDNAGGVHVRSSKIVGSAETQLGTEQPVTGLTYVAGTWVDVHMQAVNTNPTTIQMRVWADGNTEPSTWNYTTTDSTAILQQSGSIGMLTRLGAVTNTPVQISFDDLSATSSTIVTPTATPTPTPTPIPVTPFDFHSNITKVFTVVMENQNWSDIAGNTTSAPYINSLLTGVNSDLSFNPYHSDVAYANNYRSVVSGETGTGYLHPSEPNYIWLEAGTNAFSDTTFTADNSPSTQSTNSTAHLATLLNTAGKNWRAYAENKPSGCAIGNGTLYLPRHVPFHYFQDVSSTSAPSGTGTPSNASTYCSSHEFDFTQLATDLAHSGDGGGDYNFITPNTCDDMHDSGCAGGTDKIKNGDTWLSSNLPTILNSDVYKAGHAVVFVLFDEDAGSTSNNQIGMIAISPKTKGAGYKNVVPYSHSSYVKTVEEIFNLSPLLGHAADAGTNDFSDLFGDPVIAAAGDIACGVGSTSAACEQSATANLLSSINPSVVLPLGDNQYESGALSDFLSYYDPTWGVYKTLTSPAVGNHEYLTTNAAGYFDYFNGSSNQAGIAGDRSKGYYSYNVGNWHLMALNTNCSPAGGCGPGSPQETWLRADLAANPNKCLLAYSHHPMFSSGQQPHNSGVDPLFQALYDYHADVFLVGHDHNYERFYASNPSGLTDPNGITEFVVGTGGRNHTQLSSNGIAGNSAVFDATTFGVMKMTLHNASFDWTFVPSANGGQFTNGTFTETGSGSCHFTSLSTTPTATPSPTPPPAQTHTITGQVYTDTNDNGVQDGSETGYAGAAVTLTGNATGSTTSDANGQFTFTGLGAGTYAVNVALPVGYQASTSDPQTISLSGDTSINFGILQNATSFQPSAPYYATFYYNWFKNPTTDGTNQWGVWADSDANGTHSPSANWYSNYLPDASLYSSNDYANFKYEVGKLAQAKQEVAIASWWGQGDRSDTAFDHDITDFMNRTDNPYPNLRWAVIYECEGGTCNNTTNPSVTQLVSDLNYIYNNYANQPGYLRVNGKPVIFVYADPTDTGTTDTSCSDSSFVARWNKANSLAVSPFYLNLKVFAGYGTSACQPDSWYQYAPAVRTDQQGAHSYMISPGFWASGATVRLPRDLSAFSTAIQNMVNASTTWKLVETWNEWGEGTAVEPGTQVVQANGATAAVTDQNGTAFGNSYVSALSTYLPALPQGTGVTTQPTPTPQPTTFSINGNVYVDTNSNATFDLSESGYAGAQVALSGAQSATTTTDAQGAYAFSNLNVGTYTVTVTIPGGYQATSTNPIVVSISGDSTVNLGIVANSTPTPTPSQTISLSNISISAQTTEAIASWTTDVAGDSEIYYGTTTLYDTHLSADIDGVTAHTFHTNTLEPCTSYHLQLKSVDLNGNPVTSSDYAFTTLGCPGNLQSIADATALIPFDTGGILNRPDPSNSDGLRLTIPSGYDTKTSTFQAHQLPSSVLSALSAPGTYKSIENYNYVLAALPSSSTQVSDFNQPITVNISYSPEDLGTYDPGTLAVGHYSNGAWSLLPGCTINTTLHQVNCTSTSFSLFSLVSIQPVSNNTSGSHSNSNSNSGSGSGSGSNSGSSVCVSSPPVDTPKLFQVDATATSATLYFAPPAGSYDSFYISYGPGYMDEGYGVQFSKSSSTGAISYKVYALSRNSRYTFKVRANSGCAAGNWSQTVSIRTPYRAGPIQRFYPSARPVYTAGPSYSVPALYKYAPKNSTIHVPANTRANAPLEQSGSSGGPSIQTGSTPTVWQSVTNTVRSVFTYVKNIFHW